MTLDIHVIPGHFAEGAPRLLARLAAGTGHVRVVAAGAADAPPDPTAVLALLGALADTPEGERRRDSVVFRIGNGPPQAGVLEVAAIAPGPRRLLGVHIDVGPDPSLSRVRDIELGVLGLACAALAGESQGAVLVGTGLGPVGTALGRGTLAEQVEGLFATHGELVQVVVLAEGTAANLPTPEGFARSPLADLVELRRF